MLTHTTFTLKSGLMDCAPSMKELMPRTTSGIGNEAMYPATPLFDILAAIWPMT